MNVKSPTVDTQPKTLASPVIGPADAAADREAILALWQRNLPESTAQRYDWLYGSGRACNWVARDEHQSAVGSIGMMARRMSFYGVEHPCGQPVDLNVDRRYRLGWLALQLQRIIATEVDEARLGLAYGLPNAQSEAVARRSGYDVVGPVQRWARPLRTHDYLQDRIPRFLSAKAVSTGLDAALRVRWPELRYRRSREHRVEVTDCYDERFDALWREASPHFPIIGSRTADYLNWRFRDTPDTVFRALCLSDRTDRLLAYLIYTLRDDVAYMADFLWADETVADAILAEFVNMMHVQRAKAIVTIFTGLGSVVRRLRRFGFRRRPSSWKIMLHANPAFLEVPRYKLLDSSNWFLTRADVDTEF